MVHNKRILARMIATLRAIDPSVSVGLEMDSFLAQHMVEEPLCKKDVVLQHYDEAVKKAYYLVSGNIDLFCYDDKGDEHLFRIYRADRFIAVQCLFKGGAPGYSTMACKGAVLWSINAESLREMCATIPGVNDLIKSATDSCDEKELLRETLLNKNIEDRVLAFYRLFANLLPAGKVINDTRIGSYLRISAKTLRKIRKELKETGLLG